MIKKIVPFFAVIALFASCKKSKQDMLCRKWQQTSYKNEMRDKQDQEFLKFLDTLGKATPPEDLIKNYGSANIDSIKQVMLEMRDQYKEQEQKNIERTQFEFLKTGIVYLHSGNIKDSANWSLVNDNKIILDEKKLKGDGSKIEFKLLQVNDTALQIQIDENGMSAVANFVPAKK